VLVINNKDLSIVCLLVLCTALLGGFSLLNRVRTMKLAIEHELVNRFICDVIYFNKKAACMLII